MTTNERSKLWDEFLAAWPPERVAQMTLEEYTNARRDDAFIYWLESKLSSLGGIGGGSAFKFGVYRRTDTEAKAPSRGRAWGPTYAWQTRYGETPEQAFATIKARLVETVDASRTGSLARVEAIDLPPALKWKVAFLYQNRSAPRILPIFRSEALLHHYRAIDPAASQADAATYVMHESLTSSHKVTPQSLFDVAFSLYRAYDDARPKEPKAWLIPLYPLIGAEVASRLCELSQVDPEDVEPELDAALSIVSTSPGDYLAFQLDGDIRALEHRTG